MWGGGGVYDTIAIIWNPQNPTLIIKALKLKVCMCVYIYIYVCIYSCTPEGTKPALLSRVARAGQGVPVFSTVALLVDGSQAEWKFEGYVYVASSCIGIGKF